ncbi:hypothetical protein QBC39DRAFT_48072 [Podospora conica]|nr:hypothetical protein QBC39DRAFT_48072 [Schizothecium conicum]
MTTPRQPLMAYRTDRDGIHAASKNALQPNSDCHIRPPCVPHLSAHIRQGLGTPTNARGDVALRYIKTTTEHAPYPVPAGSSCFAGLASGFRAVLQDMLWLDVVRDQCDGEYHGGQPRRALSPPLDVLDTQYSLGAILGLEQPGVGQRIPTSSGLYPTITVRSRVACWAEEGMSQGTSNHARPERRYPQYVARGPSQALGAAYMWWMPREAPPARRGREAGSQCPRVDSGSSAIPHRCPPAHAVGCTPTMGSSETAGATAGDHPWSRKAMEIHRPGRCRRRTA